MYVRHLHPSPERCTNTLLLCLNNYISCVSLKNKLEIHEFGLCSPFSAEFNWCYRVYAAVHQWCYRVYWRPTYSDQGQGKCILSVTSDPPTSSCQRHSHVYWLTWIYEWVQVKYFINLSKSSFCFELIYSTNNVTWSAVYWRGLLLSLKNNLKTDHSLAQLLL